MVAESLQIILVPTLKCNADCDYCFEVKSPDTMTLDQLTFFDQEIVEYMEETGAGETTIYWQGGEVLGMGPEWYMKAGENHRRPDSAQKEKVYQYRAIKSTRLFEGMEPNYPRDVF